MLDKNQIRQYQDEGFLVLEDAIPMTEIKKLKVAALEIVDEFDIDRHRTVFTTSDRDKGRDEYFFESAENVHCFLELWISEAGAGPFGSVSNFHTNLVVVMRPEIRYKPPR